MADFEDMQLPPPNWKELDQFIREIEYDADFNPSYEGQTINEMFSHCRG